MSDRYHFTETRPSSVQPGALDVIGYAAHCRLCGWSGPIRGKSASAHDDGVAHERARNDELAREAGHAQS